VKITPFLRIVVVVSFWIGAANPQTVGHHFPNPPAPMDPSATIQAPAHPPRQHVDVEALQREANDLARTAQTIPADVVSIRKGMLPKDTLEKLKQIEKLSKRLRSELNR
jgi:hypothetical protein